MEPNNKEVHAMLQKLKTNMDNYKVRSKEVFTAMTSGAAEEDEAGVEDASASANPPDASTEVTEEVQEEPSIEKAPAPPNSPRQKEAVEDDMNEPAGPSTARRRRGGEEKK